MDWCCQATGHYVNYAVCTHVASLAIVRCACNMSLSTCWVNPHEYLVTILWVTYWFVWHGPPQALALEQPSTVRTTVEWPLRMWVYPVANKPQLCMAGNGPGDCLLRGMSSMCVFIHIMLVLFTWLRLYIRQLSLTCAKSPTKYGYIYYCILNVTVVQVIAMSRCFIVIVIIIIIIIISVWYMPNMYHCT